MNKKVYINDSIHRSRFKINIDFDTDFKFFSIIPAANINLHSKEFEIEWLFWGLYINFKTDVNK